jgi:putative acetyltransferase
MDGTGLRIRRGAGSDWDRLGRIFYRSVREGAGPDYDETQRAAWVPAEPEPARWADRLNGQKVWIAEQAGEPLGFMTLRADGHIDLAFVVPEAIGTGVAHALYNVLEMAARAAGMTRLTSDASALARIFFERRGWVSERAQFPVRHGVELHNHFMSKDL